MSYSRHSDIHLPYGKLVRRNTQSRHERNYQASVQNKSKDALWIVSHCKTYSKREQYVSILKQYISVDILGACGERWDCGIVYNHAMGDCFDILNSTYRYYLAFENALCDEYISEKFFENYKYDILQIVRGGNPKQRPLNISKEAYISTSDFKTAHDLGKYLKNLSRDTTKYAAMLKVKDEYEVVSYIELFEEAACDICQRLHNLKEHKSSYMDVSKWIHTIEPCFQPNDLGKNTSNADEGSWVGQESSVFLFLKQSDCS